MDIPMGNRQWKRLFEKYLPESEYKVITSGDLFEENEKNRKETKDYF